jgi:hypothetical protein
MSTGREDTYRERTYYNILVCGPGESMSLFGDPNVIHSQVRRALLTYLVKTFPRNRPVLHPMPIHGGHGTLYLVVVVRSARRIELVSLVHVREVMPADHGRMQMFQARESRSASALKLLTMMRLLDWIVDMLRKPFG